MSSISLSVSSKTGKSLPGLAVIRAIVRRASTSAAILLAIAFLTLFGLTMAERGQQRLPFKPLDTTVETLAQTASYLTDHPTTYTWSKQDVPVTDLVMTLLGRSVALLALAIGVATLIGVPLGILIAMFRRVPVAPFMVLISVLGISTPSFLLGMFFWVINVRAYHLMGLDSAPLPQVGFGWDAHLVMPVLVLATRPLAQILQITYISMSEVLQQDFIQVARAKGLAQRVVLSRHALRNILIPILTTMSTSLRFSLASLPVVELFFNWPGAGLSLLQAIEAGEKLLVTDLIVALGLLFLLVNLALEIIYQIVDPRVKTNGDAQDEREERHTFKFQISLACLHLWRRYRWRQGQADFRFQIAQVWQLGQAKFKSLISTLQALVYRQHRNARQSTNQQTNKPTNQLNSPSTDLPLAKAHSKRRTLRSVFGNPALIIGTLLILGIFGLAFGGERLARTNPFTLHGVMLIDGQINAPPYKPINSFPWGTDLVGRDVQGLVMAGAKRTMTLALAGMAARVLLGTILGLLAGWWKNSWLDKLVRGIIAVWAAFPVTLFAMIIILALGIQKGMWVFVVAICVVGWGETAQFIRGQVISLKPQPFVEAARAVGANSGRILRWHVLPHLFAPMLVLAILEMGGVLMLLAELGFLNIFLGGGFKLEMLGDYVYFFSDVPEWGAMLANIHRWWRAYPWMAWYPGAAFFIAILAFNLWGEGMRRLLDETRINVSRLLNRHTLLIIGVLVAGLGWSLHTSTPMALYQSQAMQFDAQAVMQDIATLASPEFQGRESGTWGSKLAAEYIVQRMREIGLQPAGEQNTYLQTLPTPSFHLNRIPRLEIINTSQTESLVYRQDFVEYIGFPLSYGWAKGQIVGLAFGPPAASSGGRTPYRLSELDLEGKILLVREANAGYINMQAADGVLVISDNPNTFSDKHLIQRADYRGNVPVLYITPQVADKLLATTGNPGSLAKLDALANSLQPGQVMPTKPGVLVRLTIEGTFGPVRECQNIIGFIPGTGANMGGARRGRGLDSEVILVSAHYDGLGIGPDGTFYPSANRNASGVATMLEIARILAEGPYTPIRTVVFVAWCGGERGDSLNVRRVMSAKRGFNTLSVEVLTELNGVGAGNGDGISISRASDPHLAQLFQNAAERLDTSAIFSLPDTQPTRRRLPLMLQLGWEGAYQTVPAVQDTPETIDPDKLKQLGQTTTLALTIISRELEY